MLRTKIFNKISNIDKLESEIQKLNKILSQDENNIAALEELGTIYHYKKQDKDAIVIFEKLKKLELDNLNIRGFLGYLYYETEDLNKAISEFEFILDKVPDSPFVSFLLGNAYSKKGLIIDAVNAYEFAIFLDFDMYNAHRDFAEKYEDMGRIERAIKEYKAAYEIDPKNKEILKKIDELEKMR